MLSGLYWSAFIPPTSRGTSADIKLNSAINSQIIPNDGLENPWKVPEPTSTLSLLALGTLGAASTLKRKLKPSKPINRKGADQ